MAALDSNALLLEAGNVWIGDDAGSVVDLGAVRNVRFIGAQVRTKIDSDNRGTIINKVRLQGRVEFDWLEPGDMNKINELFKGLVTKSVVAGVLVENYSQTINSGSWAFNQFLPFTYQDGDGTAPNIDSVTLGTNGAIVVNVDYIVTQHDDGRWGIVILDSTTVTTVAQNVVIQYDYTPAAAQVITAGTNQTATNRYLKIVGPSEDSASITREVVLVECTVTSDMVIPFVDVENANDVGIMNVVAESNKGTLFTVTDEVNAS